MPISKSYSCRLEELRRALDRAEHVVIGAGAAAGLEYSGRRFTDMYTSSFYDFRTEEERWTYWHASTVTTPRNRRRYAPSSHSVRI